MLDLWWMNGDLRGIEGPHFMQEMTIVRYGRMGKKSNWKEPF